MIQGCKDYLDNLPPDHDEILRQGLLAEGVKLSDDETPRRGTMTWTHIFSESDDEEDRHKTKGHVMHKFAKTQAYIDFMHAHPTRIPESQ
jgi:hypothetical protein